MPGDGPVCPPFPDYAPPVCSPFPDYAPRSIFYSLLLLCSLTCPIYGCDLIGCWVVGLFVEIVGIVGPFV
eukprot:3133735-Prymnesium_polylepis.1